MYNSLQQLRMENYLCDVTLVVGFVRYDVHRVILAASSEYFKNKFRKGSPESMHKEVHLNSIDDPDLLKIFLNYIYSGKAELTRTNAHKILMLANFFGSTDLVAECSSFTRKFINVKNCVKILQFAYQNNLELWKEWCGSFVVENLEKVSGSNLDFGDLPVEEVLQIIKHPAAVISEKSPAENEKQLFMLVWNRIRHADAEKLKYLKQLLEAIHLPQLDAETMNHVQEWVQKDQPEDVMSLIEEAKKAKKQFTTIEEREWYLPRYKSKGTVKITENKDPHIFDNAEITSHYSQCILIRGFPWFVSVEKKEDKNVFHLESPRAIEKMGLSGKMVAEATYKTTKKGGGENFEIGPNIYYMGVAEKNPCTQTSSNLENMKITINVKFEGASD